MGELYRDVLTAQVIRIGNRDSEVLFMSGEGMPDPIHGTDAPGAGFAGAGSIYIDETTGTWYRNMGNVANPQWKSEVVPTPEESATTVALSGASSIGFDNMVEEYEADVGVEIAGIPVTFRTDLLEAEIEAISEGDITDFVATGVEVLTNEYGLATLEVTFALDVDNTENITAAIDDSDSYVTTTADDSVAVVVDTERVTGIALTGDATVISAGDTAYGTYTAALTPGVENVDVYFSFSGGPSPSEVTDVSSGTVEQLFDGELVVSSDASGEAELIITFAADVENVGGELVASVLGEDIRVTEDLSDTQGIDVDTT